MSEVYPTYSDEIDLFELIETLWDGKWMIIASTFIAALVGMAFILYTPSSFKVSTTIQNSRPSVFVEYTPINDILMSNEFAISDDNKNGHLITPQTVFELFVSEFNDYEEMQAILQSDSFVSKSLSGLDNNQKAMKLLNYAKSFLLSPPLRNETNWTASFEWHNVEDGRKLFNDALLNTLTNVKAAISNDVAEFANSIDLKNSYELAQLQVKLASLQQIEEIMTENRIQFLNEQSAIAKELGIENNRLDSNAFSQAQNNNGSFDISPNEVLSYLRGFKAIDKEISLIRSRTKEQQLFMGERHLIEDEYFDIGYFDIKAKIVELENEVASEQLRDLLKTIENDNPNDWVEYNLMIADSKSQKNSMLYAALSIIFGAIIGAFYVLVSNAMRKRKETVFSA